MLHIRNLVFEGGGVKGIAKSTLGFRVDSTAELKLDQVEDDTDANKTDNFLKYLLGITDLLGEMANKRHLDSFDWHRTVRIDSGKISTTDFNLSKTQQDVLIEQGEIATRHYLNAYDRSWKNFVSVSP